jgi:hypothetical protein
MTLRVLSINFVKAIAVEMVASWFYVTGNQKRRI